jgi:hypothetical protein
MGYSSLYRILEYPASSVQLVSIIQIINAIASCFLIISLEYQ